MFTLYNLRYKNNCSFVTFTNIAVCNDNIFKPSINFKLLKNTSKIIKTALHCHLSGHFMHHDFS